MVSYTTLTAEQILYIHFAVIERAGGRHGLRSLDLLESSIARPFASYGEVELFPSVFLNAANLCDAIIRNLPFIDGNKRTAFNAAGIVLRRNGYRLALPNDEAVSFTMYVVNSKPSIEEIAAYLEQNCELVEP